MRGGGLVTKIMMLKMMTIETMMRKMGLMMRGGGLAPGVEDNGCRKKSHHCHTPGGNFISYFIILYLNIYYI